MIDSHKERLRKQQIKNIKLLAKRTCPTCKKEYKPTSFQQIYCKPTCRQSKQKQEFPKMICDHCKNIIQLDFFPRNNLAKLEDVKCPKCKKYVNQRN